MQSPTRPCPFQFIHEDEGDSNPECQPDGLTFPSGDIYPDPAVQVESQT